MIQRILHLAGALLLLCLPLQDLRSQTERPKIGITLSGGGAKGMAHIGLLKAIDSAGLKVDYVTGTSMGAIWGGLYAAGYSGEELLQLSRQLDWTSLLSNDMPLDQINLREKEEFGHYLELPLQKGKLSLKRGIIESTELWLKLAEVYFPYYDIDDFSQFDKGFQCIATDVQTGKMVVLSRGDIVNAVRASMAIPSVFTPVDIDGKVLIDGGLTRNFPVSNLREMGAQIVIGSDVSDPVNTSQAVKSPFDIFSRLPFYHAVADLEEQRKLVDLYFDFPLEGYGSSSFGAIDAITEIGLKKGKEAYPSIKRLKDSLDLIYGPSPALGSARPTKPLVLSSWEVKGVGPKKAEYFIDLIGFRTGEGYLPKDLSQMIRHASATRNFSKITYSLKPQPDGTARIVFQVDEAVSTAARFGAHYNTAIGIALKVGLVKRGWLNPSSLALATLSLGENPRGEVSFTYYLGKRRKIGLRAENNFEITDINTYDEKLHQTGLYNMASQNCDLQLFWQPDTHWLIGTGTTLANVAYQPEIISEIQAKGSVAHLHTYLLVQHSSLNRLLYPTRGHFISLKGGVIYNQVPNFEIWYNDELIGTEESPLFGDRPYTQIRANLEQYFPIGRHSVFGRVQSGLNFSYRNIILNDFRIGGLNNVVRNQIVFAGLPEAAIFSSSVLSAQIGYRHAITENFFLTAIGNGLWYDFIDSNLTVNRDTNGMGCSLTAGYRTFLGPIEASLTYSDLNRDVLPYFNVGYVLSLD